VIILPSTHGKKYHEINRVHLSILGTANSVLVRQKTGRVTSYTVIRSLLHGSLGGTILSRFLFQKRYVSDRAC